MSLKEGREGELNAPPYLKRLGERIGEGQKRGNSVKRYYPVK